MKMIVDRKRRVPLYRQCADAILQGIEEGSYRVGEYLPSERDLSRELGVNRMTLRQGIRELALRGLVEKSPCTGTRVIRSAVIKSSSKAVGCLVFQKVGSLPVSPYYAAIYRGIQEEIAESGFDLFLASVSDEDLYGADGLIKASPGVLSNEFAGVIFTGGLPNELLLAYRARGISVVLIDKEPPNPTFSAIVPDHRAGAYELGRCLVEMGHRRIGFLAAPPDPVVEARFTGFLEALGERAISFRPEDYVLADYECKFAYPAMQRRLEKCSDGFPTAWIAINDEAAIGAMRALRETGIRIPEDVSVAGFDDIPDAERQKPPLTTVRIRLEEMGRLAARILVRQLESERFAPTRIVLRPDLVMRASVARPKE